MKESWSLFNVPYSTACLQQGCLRGACHRSAQQSWTSSQNSYLSHTSCTAPGPGITRPETRTANNWCWHFHRGVEHLCLQVGSIPIRIWHGRPIYPVPIVPMCRTYTWRQPTKGQPTRHLAATRRPSPCHAFTSGDPGSHLCLMHQTSSDAPRMGWSVLHLFHTSMCKMPYSRQTFQHCQPSNATRRTRPVLPLPHPKWIRIEKPHALNVWAPSRSLHNEHVGGIRNCTRYA